VTRVAVLSLTRDRLSYTRHCFGLLHEQDADFDHYVLDQGSDDGSVAWLSGQPLELAALPENIGCCRGWNFLLETYKIPERYDVVVCFDNDCELIQPNTLKTVAGLAAQHQTILSPRVLGLRYPVPVLGEFELDEHTILETAILGNIFMAIPASVFDEFRFDETNLPWAGGEAVTAWYRSRGGRCGYVRGFEVNHYETTDGQHETYPAYFARRLAEGAPD
jgi:hypothetical protein